MYAAHVLPAARDYDALYRSFRWQVPARYNIGVDVCDRWARDRSGPHRDLRRATPTARSTRSAMARCASTSNRLANALAAPRHRARRPRRDPAAAGAGGRRRAMSRSTSSAPSRCRSRCCSASRRLRIGSRIPARRRSSPTRRGWPSSPASATRCRISSCVLSIDGAGDGAEDFHAAAGARGLADFTPVDTGADDPALMIYTSGTTGPPKGALHAHRVLLGHLPGVELPHEFLPQPGDRFWTPADWAWAGGLLDVLLPALHYGVPVVAQRFEKFDPEEAFALMARTRRAQRLHPADGAAHAARGRPPARALRPRAAHDRLRRRGARRARPTNGASGARPHHQRVLRPDRVQSGARLLRAPSACRRPGAIGKAVPGHTVAVIRAGRPRVRARRARPDRGAAARPGDVPGILGQARRDARQVHRRLDDDRRPGRRRRGRLRRTSSAATTTSSPRPAIASGRARSRIA